MPLFSLQFDNVEVLDSDFNQLFVNAKMMRADVRPMSRPMEHPLESGSVITDHRIILPVEISLIITLLTQDVKDIYNQINALYLSATSLIVQTRSASYKNQYILGLPHAETPEQLGVITINLRLKEAQFATTQSTTTQIDPSSASDQNTVDRGTQEAEEPGDQVNTSGAVEIFGGGA